MAFWLKKVIGYWLMPLPFSLALILGGALLWRFSRFQRIARTLTLTGILWLVLTSNVGIGTLLVGQLENRYPAQPDPAALARCEFIVVLGGGHTPVPAWTPANQLSPSALSRIVEGTRLAHALPAARIIVSGPADKSGTGPSHARIYADTAVSLGIARDRIHEISDARDTEQEAAAVARLTGDRPVALVTSAWHQPRSMALFQAQGVNALACPADFAARPPQPRLRDFLSWNLGGLERSTKAIYEHLGTTWSRLRGKT
jgi:uncharacterized SAM-binding protein YcdF (DUF218 family)